VTLAPDAERLAAALARAQGRQLPGQVAALTRLSGGANMETWAFDLELEGKVQALILRRRPLGVSRSNTFIQSISLFAEADLLGLARRAQVSVPTVCARLSREDELGEGIIMTRLQGEALPQRLLREERYGPARQKLAFQCGEALGRIHGIALDECPAGLRDLHWMADLQRLQALCDRFGNPSPAHQLAISWLQEQAPPPSRRVLCHGDFRLGNLLVNETGLTAVLDWELAHIGHAGEDLGYLCANVWRFGSAAPVGGFGDYRQLLDGYRSVCAWAPELEELRLWELYAALGWGLVCLIMQELHRSGEDTGLERAAVARRFSESEVDTLLLLEDLGA
jgi:aminoglycoside phosphotransferase (APT) family kinase protein